jgi:hypothetical protein
VTQARPQAPSTGRLLGTSSSSLSQDEQVVGMIVVLASCTASTNLVSPGPA